VLFRSEEEPDIGHACRSQNDIENTRCGTFTIKIARRRLSRAAPESKKETNGTNVRPKCFSGKSAWLPQFRPRPSQMSHLEVLLFRKLSVKSSQRKSFLREQKPGLFQNLPSSVTSANCIPISCSQNEPAFQLCTQTCIEMKTCSRTQNLTDDSSWLAASSAGPKSTHNVSNSTSRSDLSDGENSRKKHLNYRRRFGIVETMMENDVMEMITHIAAEASIKNNLSDREIRLGKKLRYKRRCSIVGTMIDNASLVLIPDLETSKKRKKSWKSIF